MKNKTSIHPVIKKRLKIYDKIKKDININQDFDVVFNAKIKPATLKKLKLVTI